MDNSRLNFFEKLKNGLSKTRKNLTSRINNVFHGFNIIDNEVYDELEEILISADIGIKTTMDIIDSIKARVKEEKVNEPANIIQILKQEILKILDEGLKQDNNLYPKVIIVIGVNGVGKTTSIGKIAYRLKESGKKVLIAAGDTFRAAAMEQLEVWSNRIKVDMIKHRQGADPAAVLYDAISSAKSKKIDVVICDTAGRLHNKKNLMEELKKIIRIADREYPEAHKEILLVLDATTGQNAIAQAKAFKEVSHIDGIILTKLDGTAKGGIVVAIKEELGIPVKLIGVGEQIDDLQDFKPEEFVEALFSE